MKWGWLVSWVVVTSCTVGPDFVRPEVPDTQQYTQGQEPIKTQKPAGGEAQSFITGMQVPENWWRLFHSPQLDPVVREALLKNQTLQSTLATLRQSQQNVLAGEGVFYPQVNANAGASRLKSSPTSFGVNGNPSIFNLITLSSTVSYALDFFGGSRRALEALKAQAALSRYTVQAAYLTLTGNIVNAMIARAAYQAQIQATQEIIRLQADQIRLTQANVRAGTVAYAQWLSLQAQQSATQAVLPLLAQKLSQTDHLLALLSGKMPVQWTAPPIVLADLTLPQELPRTLPSELVRRRPDILQAEALLHIASARVGIATAALYPSLALSGTIGLNSPSSGELFKAGSEFWNLGAGLTAPLFRGGTLRAQKQAAVEAFEAALADYRQAVLAAIGQVADALRGLEHDAELVQAQTQAVRTADESLKIIAAQYQAGTTSELPLLLANAQYFQARIGYLQSIASRYQDTVGLFMALGGAMEPESK